MQQEIKLTIETPEIARWLKNHTVSDVTANDFGELRIVSRANPNPDAYQFVRCFVIGGEVAVSVDYRGSIQGLVAFLMTRYVK